MRTSKFSETQIVAILKEADAGAKVKDLCRKHGISDATYYKWKSKYGGMDASELKRVKELENDGYSFEAAGGTLELLIRRESGDYQKPFQLTEYHTSFRQYRDGHPPVCESTVKLVVNGTPELTVAEGNGVVNALDLALRKALLPFYSV